MEKPLIYSIARTDYTSITLLYQAETDTVVSEIQCDSLNQIAAMMGTLEKQSLEYFTILQLSIITTKAIKEYVKEKVGNWF